MSEASYFVGIDQPADVRRNLLETAKLSVSILKAQYRLKKLRSRKLDAIDELKVTVADLDDLMDQMQSMMPEHKLEAMPDVAQRIEKKHLKKQEAARAAAKSREKAAKAASKKAPDANKPAKPVAPVRKELSEREELNLLEQKLADIETKLNKL